MIGVHGLAHLRVLLGSRDGSTRAEAGDLLRCEPNLSENLVVVLADLRGAFRGYFRHVVHRYRAADRPIELPAAPSSGTITPFARSCGSSTTPRGSRTTPYVMCAWSRTFCQYAMGREANTRPGSPSAPRSSPPASPDPRNAHPTAGPASRCPSPAPSTWRGARSARTSCRPSSEDVHRRVRRILPIVQGEELGVAEGALYRDATGPHAFGDQRRRHVRAFPVRSRR